MRVVEGEVIEHKSCSIRSTEYVDDHQSEVTEEFE
jgi:hypothetical protein